jgi:hypothetical protein
MCRESKVQGSWEVGLLKYARLVIPDLTEAR